MEIRHIDCRPRDPLWIWSQPTPHTITKQTNNMRKLLATTVALGFTAAAAVAGPYYSSKSTKEVVPPPPPAGCVCFDGGTIEVSAFGAGMLPSDEGHLDDELGGGVGIGYFFSPNVGVEANYAALAQSSTVHLFTANLVLRAPITDACIAPYLLVGGGVHANSVTQGIWNLGGGFDWRFDQAGCLGLFADAVYTWAEDSSDYTIVRIGIRKSF